MTKAYAYYNDNNPYVVEYLLNLMRDGLISKGVVDPASIVDVAGAATDQTAFGRLKRAHFFAGVGGWDLALQIAGWQAEREVWTASLPCQPFSSAGRKRGIYDSRHLWPVFYKLVQAAKPATILGEQVAGKRGEAWLSNVFDDLETEGYETWATDLPACSVGPPHKRQRLFWVGHAPGDKDVEHVEGGRSQRIPIYERQRQSGNGATNQRRIATRNVGHSESEGGRRDTTERGGQEHRGSRSYGNVADTVESGLERRKRGLVESQAQLPTFKNLSLVLCRDNKVRPIPTQPLIFPLAYGLPRGLGTSSPELRRLAQVAGIDRETLRGARRFRRQFFQAMGNAIVPEVAALFVETAMGGIDAWEQSYELA